MFEAFGLADQLIHEGYQVNEVAFWRPDPDDPTKITQYVAHVLPLHGDDALNNFFAGILNDARWSRNIRPR